MPSERATGVFGEQVVKDYSDYTQLCHACTWILNAIGEKEREGLKDTPSRFAHAWAHWTAGYHADPESVLKSFEDGAQNYDQMIVQKHIPVFSLCEHHMAPFFGVAHIAYIPEGRILGLSKFSRLVDIFSRRLQVQERLTAQIADALDTHLKPKGVGVILECRHLCLESRGIQRMGTTTTTSAMRGAILNEDATRAEFLHFVRTP